MIKYSATEYFHKVSGLLLELQVTNSKGLSLSVDEGVSKAVELILSRRSGVKKIMLIGNGGSAAIASHMQNDLCKAARIQAIVFNEIPLLTALSNDHGYESVFERSIELWANKRDLLLAISSSGKSQNILRAARVALTQNCGVITFSGFNATNPLRRLGHLNFYVPSWAYGHVETVHSVLAHFLTDCAMKESLKRKKK